jgi:hypothetical protein
LLLINSEPHIHVKVIKESLPESSLLVSTRPPGTESTPGDVTVLAKDRYSHVMLL